MELPVAVDLQNCVGLLAERPPVGIDHGRAVAPIALGLYEDQITFEATAQLAQNPHRVVGGAVVDHHEDVVGGNGIEGDIELGDERGDPVGLVVGGNGDGDRWRQGHRIPDARHTHVILAYSVGDYALAVVAVTIGFAPVGVSVWALLDAARRPSWVWAMADRDRTHWMAAILFTAVIIGLGLVVAGYYLTRVRSTLAGIEEGNLDA